MAKLKFVLLLLFVLFALGRAEAGTYTLSDGQTITGDPTAYDANGVVFKLPTGNFSPRTLWSRFNQDSLKQLASEAKKESDAEFIQPYLEETVLEEAKQSVINIKPPEKIERPTGRTGLTALFGSSLGLFLFAVLYGANLFAAFEIAHFKNMPVPIVMGAAAVLPFIAPIVFLCIPRRTDSIDAQITDLPGQEAQAQDAAAPTYGTAAPQYGTAAPHYQEQTGEEIAEHGENPPIELSLPATPVSAPAPAVPSVTFPKGQFSFNRRFFETKMPGFFRVVPTEADKDMILQVKAIRGEYIARRISKITQTEVHLETFKGQATAEEVVPFTEIQEVSIRHKDSV